MDKHYTFIIEEQTEKLNSTVEHLLRSVPSVNTETSCLEVLDLLHEDKNLYALPIVNSQNQPLGLITRLELTEHFSKQFSKEIKGKKPISTLMDNTVIIVEKETGIEDVARIILDAGIRHMLTGFIITKDGNYLGMATGYDLLDEITSRKQKQLFELAHFDHLTGLPNRRLLVDRLQHSLVSSMRTGSPGALLFIDLDHFKTINDTLGHHIGDVLLQQVAERLSSTVRGSDTVARLGGDEFVVMLEDLGEHHAEPAAQLETVGEKILATLGQPYQLAGQEYRITPSIGATLFIDALESPDELLKQADIAMYQAKNAGRNTLRFFDPKMQKDIEERAFLEYELRNALEKNQFQLLYQIQVDSSGQPSGVEALIRWIHPDRGVVSPIHFIPMAEETGLILPIGKWVMELACKQLVKWSTQSRMLHLTIAVNVSAAQFHQDNFADQVLEVVESTGANPHLLKLELTESMLITDIEEIIVKMETLKKRGVGFSLDDFGTGYSSLAYLSSELPSVFRLPGDGIHATSFPFS